MLAELEDKYQLPRGLLNAVMMQESGGDPKAVSPKGAVGLFQFMPETAKELGIDPNDPAQAAEGAARYLRQNLDRFGTPELALAAYNAGPGNVQKHGGIPNFPETQNYVQDIMGKIALDQAPQDNEAMPQGYELVDDAMPEGYQLVEPEKSDPGMAAYAGFVKGVPFGGDIVSSGLATTQEVPFTQDWQNLRKGVKNELNKQYDLGAEQNPVSTYAPMAVSAVGSTLATPSSWLKGASVAERALRGAGVAGGWGAIYGAGEGETLQERGQNALGGGASSAIAGLVGTPALEGAGNLVRSGYGLGKRAVGPLTEKAQRILGRVNNRQAPAPLNRGAPPVADDIIARTQQALNQPIDQTMAPGGVIKLTQGQATQLPKQQALEQGALVGNYGDEAQRIALEAADLQSAQARGALQQVAGREITNLTPLETAETSLKTLQTAYRSAKQKTNAAYKKVGELTQEKPLFIGADYIKQTVVPSFRDWAQKGGSGLAFDLGAPGMENANRLYKQGLSINNFKKLTSVAFNRMENWRARVSQGIANSKTPSEKAFLSGLLQRYDDAITNLPREAIKSGDDAIVSAMEKARGARAQQGKLFERQKIVKNILETDDITPEEFWNITLGGGPAFTAKSGRAARQIIKASDNEIMRELLKQGAISKILNNSLKAEVKAGTTENMVSFDKLATNLENYIYKNKTLFNELHPDQAERDLLINLYKDVKLIKSAKPGTRNYSNSAYTLINLMRKISPSAGGTQFPVVGGVNNLLKSMGDAKATLDAEESFAPIFNQTLEYIQNQRFNFAQRYGSKTLNSVLGAYYGSGQGETQDDGGLEITVRPSDAR